MEEIPSRKNVALSIGISPGKGEERALRVKGYLEEPKDRRLRSSRGFCDYLRPGGENNIDWKKKRELGGKKR